MAVPSHRRAGLLVLGALAIWPCWAQETASPQEIIERVIAAHLAAHDMVVDVTEWMPHPFEPDRLVKVTVTRAQAYPPTAESVVGIDLVQEDVSGTNNRVLIRGRAGIVEIGLQKLAVRAEAEAVLPGALMSSFGMRYLQGKLFGPFELIFREVQPDDITASEIPTDAEGGPGNSAALLVRVRDGGDQLVWFDKSSLLVRQVDCLTPDGQVIARYTFGDVPPDEATKLRTEWAQRPQDLDEDYRLPAGYGRMSLETYRGSGILAPQIRALLDGVLARSLDRAGTVGVRADRGGGSVAANTVFELRGAEDKTAYAVRSLSGFTYLNSNGPVSSFSGRILLTPEPDVSIPFLDGLHNHVIRPGMRLHRDKSAWIVEWERDVPVPVPHEADACFNLALGLICVGRHTTAVPVIERLIALKPGDGFSLLLSAETKRAAGDLPGAKKALDRALTTLKAEADAYRLQGRVAEDGEDWAGAVRAFARAVECDSTSVRTRRQLQQAQVFAGDLDAGAETVKAALAIARPPQRPRLLLDQGWVQVYRGDFAAGVEAAKATQALKPALAEAYYLEASAQLYQAKVADAVQASQAAIERDPGAAGYGQQMVAQLEATLKQSPGTTGARLLLGYLYEAAGRIPEARDQYRKFAVASRDADLKKLAQDRLEATNNWNAQK